VTKASRPISQNQLGESDQRISEPKMTTPNRRLEKMRRSGSTLKVGPYSPMAPAYTPVSKDEVDTAGLTLSEMAVNFDFSIFA
jgi:hypothetical protein